MMAQPFPAPGMGGPGHPGMPHGHPMGVPHPGAGHMGGQPGPGMMQGMHPGVTGPQVSQGPMVTGMPPGAGTPAPMQQNGMAMAHLGPQQHMFQGGGQPQMNIGQMQQINHQAALMRQRMVMQRQQNMPMNMNSPHFQQQMAQMTMGMPMQPQPHMQNMHSMQQQQQQQQAQFAQQQSAQQQSAQQQQQQHQQRIMAHHAAQQQAAMRQAHNQQNAAQQMQMSRSQEPATQPPQPLPTPAPSNQPPQPQPQQNVPQQQQPPPQPPKPQPTPQPVQQQGTPAASVKDVEPEEPPIKQQDASGQVMMQDIPKQQPNDFTGQCILQLLLYQDKLANPERPTDLAYWEEIIQKYFSPTGSVRQQLYNNKAGNDKTYQLNYPSLARFFYTHFTTGIKHILMQSFDHNQSRLPNGGIHIWSNKASLTYVFVNDLRVTTQGSLRVNFDDMQKIEHLFIATSGWTEYVPRHLLAPLSPNQTSPKMTNKTAKKPQKTPNPGLMAPPSSVSDFGLPPAVLQFLEIAEVVTAMGPLMEFFHANPGISPTQALQRISNEGAQMNMVRMQNANMMAANGQMGMPPQQRMGMNMPNQFQSPALQHLGLPQGQGSPGMASNHTGSPAQSQGGIPMMHQMSAQGSNMSGSHGASTNTSPNVSNKRRRASGVKMEDENSQQDASGGDKVKPSPRMGGKRQKGQA